MARKRTVRLAKRNDFDHDLEGLRGEYEPPNPTRDRDGVAIAQFLSRLARREKTGWVTNWRPVWGKDVRPFRYFFFEDLLLIDTYEAEFGPPGSDVDVLRESPAMEADITAKMVLCAENGFTYVAVRPDEELEMVQLASRLGQTKVKKQETVAYQEGKVS